MVIKKELEARCKLATRDFIGAKYTPELEGQVQSALNHVLTTFKKEFDCFSSRPLPEFRCAVKITETNPIHILTKIWQED
jgi:hypothetical protein